MHSKHTNVIKMQLLVSNVSFASLHDILIRYRDFMCTQHLLIHRINTDFLEVLGIYVI